jgi:hypothetical protein
MPPAAAAAAPLPAAAPAADIRGSISYVCALLSSYGVGGLSAEALRQAKFDAAAPAERLWRALHDVLALALARGRPRGDGSGSGSAGGIAGSGAAAATALEAAWRSAAPHGGVPADGAALRSRTEALFPPKLGVLCADTLALCVVCVSLSLSLLARAPAALFVVHTLEVWGYPRGALAALPPPPPPAPSPGARGGDDDDGATPAPPAGARPLLLALGWALQRTAALQRALQARLRSNTARAAAVCAAHVHRIAEAHTQKT